jgi:hypothetical protein
MTPRLGTRAAIAVVAMMLFAGLAGAPAEAIPTPVPPVVSGVVRVLNSVTVVPNATVRMTPTAGGSAITAKTNAIGRYQMNLPKGTYVAQAETTKYGPNRPSGR